MSECVRSPQEDQLSYVGDPFLHDLFITYSHGGDDGAGQGYLLPWSEAFKKELDREFRVNRKFRDDLRVFIDKDHRPGHGVDPMEPLSEELCKQIGGSAVVVALMSPDYLASDWCRRERDWWQARQRELDLPTKGRIAVVRSLPTEDSWPELLTDTEGNQLVGFLFHAAVEHTVEVRPLGWLDLPGDFGKEAHTAILNLVGHLSPKLYDLRVRLEERRRAKAEAEKLARAATGDGQPIGEGDAVTIYLHGRVDQRRSWERAAAALIDGGFGVMPGEPDTVERDPIKLEDARAQRVRTLSDCDALLLVGSDNGRALDEDLVTVGRQDRNSARALSKRLLPCGLLDTVGAPIATPVRKATARILQTEWIDATHDPWTSEIRRWLGARSSRAGA
jgi:hypothetical protein